MGARAVAVAIIEHEPGAVSLATLLDGFGFQLSVCSPDAVLSTAGLPVDLLIIGASGPLKLRVGMCRTLRAAGYSGDVIAVVGGRKEGVSVLDAGADDFVVEPVDVTELVSRVRAALRRHRERWQSRWEEVEIDRARRSASLRGTPLTLTPREYDLLAVLVEAGGEIVSRADLFARIRGRERDPASNLVEVHFSRLRDKLGSDAGMIETVRGAGYRMRKA
jgi:DNA-binding response OmpR family regulator